MLRRWNKYLAVLLAITLMATTFNSSRTSIKVFAEDEDAAPAVEETVAAAPAEDYQEPADEPAGEPESEPEEGAPEEEYHEEGGDDVELPASAEGENYDEPGGDEPQEDIVEDDEEEEDSEDEELEDEELEEESEEEPEEEPEDEELEEEIIEKEAKLVTVTYKADLGGFVSNNSETVDVNDENAKFEGSTATAANMYYQFTAWVDGDGNPVSSSATLIPSGIEADVTYTAKFMKLSAMPEQDFSGSDEGMNVSVHADEGIFPEGTTMVVTAISDSQAYDAAVDALGESVVEAKGVDITFYGPDGNKVEPADSKYVQVSISLPTTLEGESFSVIHQDDSGNADVIAGASAGGADFDANQFSVYIVASGSDTGGDTEEEKSVATYTFYVGEDVFNVQILKKGETLNFPGIPDLDDNQEFFGWYDSDNNAIFPEGQQTLVLDSFESDYSVDAYADIKTTYYLTFKGISGENVEVKNITVTEGESADIDTTDVIVQPESVEEAFLGWTTVEGGTTVYKKVDASVYDKVYPVIQPAYWVTFDENDGGAGGGASYTPPISVAKGEAPVLPDPPTRRGYEFDGWYTGPGANPGEVSGDLFDENYVLTGNLMVYAKWNPSESTTYTVIIWQQKITDSKNTTDNQSKNYDFVRAITKEGVTGTPLDESASDPYEHESYEGFHYSWSEIVRISGDKKIPVDEIRAKGDTVINVYYDRNLMTIEFYTRPNNSGNNWSLSATYTGLYGQTLSENGYTWPDTHYWYDKKTTNQATRLTFLDVFRFTNLAGTSEHDTKLVQYGHSKSGSNHVYFIQQNINGSYPNTATDTIAFSGGTFNFTNKYTGFEVAEYRVGEYGDYTKITKKADGSYGSVETTDYWGNTYDLYVRFRRLSYDITFMDNFNGNIDDIHQPIEGIPYQDEISKYSGGAPELSNKTGYTFKGWYEDTNGQRKFVWSGKMPAADKVLYAYYQVDEYQVTIDFDGGTPAAGQSSSFTKKYGETIDRTQLDMTTKEGFELAGWFDTDNNKPYGFGEVIADVNLLAIWRNPGVVSIEYSAGDHGSNPPEDNYKYSADSHVVVGPPPTPDNGYTFIGYTVGNSGTLYYPGGYFKITPAAIENETVTFTAQYLKTGSIDDLTTIITYNANGGNGADYPVLVGLYGKLLVNEPVVALGNDVTGFSREGYEFIGWSLTSGENNSVDFEAGQRICADNEGLPDVPNMVYAVWKPTTGRYIVEYYKGEATYEQDTDHFLDKTDLSEPQTIGTLITLTEEELNYRKSMAGVGYQDGRQTELPYEIKKGDDNIIQVVYDPIAVTITINGIEDTVDYDGKEHPVSGFTAEASDPNYDVSYVTYDGSTEISEVHAGVYTLEFTNAFFANDPAFDSSAVTVKLGDVKGNKLTINPKELSITTLSDLKAYDGEPLTAGGNIDGLVEGDTVDFQTTGTITDPGETPNTYSLEWTGSALEDDYVIPEENIHIGTLVVTQYEGEILIVVQGGEFPYDGGEHSATVDVQGLPDGYSFVASSSATVTNVDDGVVEAEADSVVIYDKKGVDVTDEMQKTYTTDTIKIIPVDVKVYVVGNTTEHKYTGDEYTAEGYEITNVDNPLYDKSNVTFTGEAIARRSVPGQTFMMLSEKQFGNTDNNFNASFDITDGYVLITDRGPGEKFVLTATTTSFSREYTGEKFTDFDFDITGEDPADTVMEETVDAVIDLFTGLSADAADYTRTKTVQIGDKEFRVEGLGVNVEARDVDDYPLTITGDMKVYDGNVEVTKQFTLNKEEGVFTITPKPITVTSDSDSKVYNGQPLINHTVTTDVPWGIDDEVFYEVTGSQTEVGSSENTFEIIWGDTNPDNYDPEIVFGTLTVRQQSGPTPPPPVPTPDPVPGGPTTTVIPDAPAPTAPAPAPAVLGERREEENGQAVLGARRGRTEDESNTAARVFAILIAAAAAITIFATRKKEEEEN